MVREFLWSRRRLLGVLVLCVILTSSLAALWQRGHVAEAAVLDPHPGLVGWWRFDEGFGSVVKDSSGFGNDGMVYGATWVDGEYGKALSFDGSNDYISLPVIRDHLGTAFTLACWLKRNVALASMWLVDLRDASYRGPMLAVDLGDNIRVDLQDAAGNFYSHTAAGVSDLLWHFIVGLYEAPNIIIYKDGVEVGRKNVGSFSLWTGLGGESAIGAQVNVHDRVTNGLIDEVRVYNRALSPAEIQASFQKRPDFSSKLLAKVPKGTTQVIVTLSWQGIGSINITIESPSKSYTEGMVPVYQKTVYSTSGGTSSMLNIKRLSISINPLSSDENWYIMLEFDNVEDYRITVEVQR